MKTESRPEGGPQNIAQLIGSTASGRHACSCAPIVHRRHPSACRHAGRLTGTRVVALVLFQEEVRAWDDLATIERVTQRLHDGPHRLTACDVRRAVRDARLLGRVRFVDLDTVPRLELTAIALTPDDARRQRAAAVVALADAAHELDARPDRTLRLLSDVLGCPPIKALIQDERDRYRLHFHDGDEVHIGNARALIAFARRHFGERWVDALNAVLRTRVLLDGPVVDR